jgi:GAF domain-containing protein
MSENRNKNHLHNRLDSLFSDLGASEDLPGLTATNQLNGWLWEIDLNGQIINTSPEVELLLGYDPANLLEQPITTISNLDPANGNLPQTASQTVPFTLDMIFFRVDGSKHKTQTQIQPIFNASKALTGWRGITLSAEDQEPASAALTEALDDDALIGQIAPPITSPEPVELVQPVDENLQNAPLVADSPAPADDQEKLSYEELYVSTAYQPSDTIRNFLQSIDNDPHREWQPDELQLVEQVHSQMELAMENARLFRQTQLALAETDEQARRLRLLNDLSEKVSQAEVLNDIYEATASTAEEIFDADHTLVLLQMEQNFAIQASRSRNSRKLDQERLTTEHLQMLRSHQQTPVQVHGPGPDVIVPGSRAALTGGLLSGNKLTGVISVESSESNRFQDQDRNFMAQLISIVNGALENRILLDRIQTALASTEEQARRLAVLNQLSEQLGQARTLEEIISLTITNIDNIIPCNVSTTAIRNPDPQGFLVYQLSQKNGQKDPVFQSSGKTLIEQIAEDKRLYSDYDLASSEHIDLQAWIEDEGISSVIGAPLLSGDQAIGAIMIGSRNEFTYSLQDEALLLSISSILASTLDNRQLFQQIQRRSIQLETSAEVSRIASTILDTNELLPRVADLIKTGFNLYYTGIFLVDQDGSKSGEPNRWAFLQAGTGEAGEKMIAEGHKLELGGGSMIGSAISSSQAKIALNTDEESQRFRNPFLPETRSEMALPLVSRGEVLGALSIQSEQDRAFSQEDITSLQTMADQLANAIENARLFEQTEARARELTVLNEMARAYTQTLDVERLIEHTYAYTNRLLDAANFYMALYDDHENQIHFRLFVEDGQPIPPPEPKIVIGNGLTDWIIQNKTSVLIPREFEKELIAMGIQPRGRTALSYLGVPMLIGNQVIGVIAVQSYQQENNYTNRHLDMLTAVSSQAAVAIDNAIRFQQTRSRAQFEQVMREITTRVHSSTNPETILKTAVREVSTALGRNAYIELSPDEKQITTGSLTFDEDPDSSPDARNAAGKK